MKRALLVCLSSLFCTAAAPNMGALDCSSLCARSESECKKNCGDDGDCAAACRESTQMCPKMCAAMKKHQGDPKRMAEAMRQVVEREEAARQAREEAREQAQETGRHRH